MALAAENPPEPGERVQVFNQVAEVHSVRELAEMISSKTGTQIGAIDNPRKELPKNNLKVCNQGLRSLGFNPIKLEDSLMDEIESTVVQYSDRLDKNVILSKAVW